MTTESTLTWLPEDLTGRAASNFVQGEVHRSETVGTLSQFVVTPAEGAFYDTENLRVVYHTQSDDTVLLRGNDYRLVGIDFGRTKVSSAKGGVYAFILITTAFNYNASSYITIDYQAFGGYLTYMAYSRLYEDIKDVQAKVSGYGFLTTETLAESDIVQSIVSSLQAISSRIQYMPAVSYLMQTSAGASLVWNTIAVSTESFDDRIDMTDPSTLKGVIVLSFFSKEWNMKVAVSFDMSPANAGLSEVLNGAVKADVLYQQITSLDTNVPLNDEGFFLNGKMLLPKFRMVLDKSSSAHPRAYLQMALCSNSSRNVELAITNSTDINLKEVGNVYDLTSDQYFQSGKVYYTRTGVDNYFRYTQAAVTPGQPVPSGTYYEMTSVSANIADFSSDFSLVNKIQGTPVPTPPVSNILVSGSALALKDPYKIWEGNVNLTFVESLSWNEKTITHEYDVDDVLDPGMSNGYPAIPFCPGKCLEAYTVKTFVCDIYDRLSHRLIRTAFPATVANPYVLNGQPGDTVQGTVMYYPPDLATLTVVLSLTSASKSLNLFSKAGKNTNANERFDLRAIYIQ